MTMNGKFINLHGALKENGKKREFEVKRTQKQQRKLLCEQKQQQQQQQQPF